MQKRLLGIVGQRRRHRGGVRRCHHHARRRRRASVAPGASAAAAVGRARACEPRCRADPQDRHRAASPRRSTRTRPRTRPRIAVLHALHRGLVYIDEDLKVVPALAESLPRSRPTRKTLTFKLRDAQVQQRRPDRRRRPRLQLEAPRRPAHRGPVLATSWPKSSAAGDLLDMAGADPAADRRRDRRAASTSSASRRRTTRRSSSTLDHAGHLLPERR